MNIKAEGATIGNLLGGGAAGTTNNNINIEIGNAAAAAGEGESAEGKETTIKALYGGGHGDVAGNINIGINGGNITSQLVGGTIRTTDSANVAGEISLTIKDVEFTGSMITGGSYINFTNNAAAATVADVNVAISGGEAKSASLYGAGYAYSSGTNADGVEYSAGNITIDITDGTVGSKQSGRGIFGGAFASGVDASVADVSITISGTAAAGNIFGGGWAQQGGSSVVTGAVDITISGGSANVIYGGGAHSNTSTGSTSVASVNITVSGGSAMAIYAGGQTTGDTVTGDAVITVTGAFASETDLYGTGYEGVDTVAGSSTLNFADYTGTYSGTIANFDDIIFSGDTVAAMTGAAVEAANLTFDLAGRTAAANAFVGFGADSTIASVDIKADTANAATSSWDILTTTGSKITDFDLFVGDAASAIDLTVGEAIVGGVFNGWAIQEIESEGKVTYKFAVLANA